MICVATSGVQAAGDLPDFLSEDQGEVVIESLVSASEQPETEVQPDVEVDSTTLQVQATESVVSDLLEGDRVEVTEGAAGFNPRERSRKLKHAAPLEAAGETGRTRSADDPVDRDVIDSLLDSPEEPEGG